jgi:hypothetical protein
MMQMLMREVKVMDRALRRMVSSCSTMYLCATSKGVGVGRSRGTGRRWMQKGRVRLRTI